MRNTIRIQISLIAVAAATLFLHPPLQAQTELKDADRATVMFDLRVDKLMADLKAAGVDVDDVAKMPLSGPLRDCKLGDVVRIYGAMSMPKSLESVMNFRPDATEPPINAYVRIRFNSTEKAEAALESLKQRGDEVEINGAKYMVENARRPEFSMAHLSDMSELEMGTGTFVLHPNRDLMTERLAAGWKNVPNHAFRVAVDLESNAAMIAETMAFAEANAPPVAVPFIGLLDNAKGMVFSVDAKSDTLLQLVIDGKNQADAQELQEGLDSIFALAKMSGAAGVNELRKEMPEVAKPAKALLDSLKATQKDDQVTIAIPKPEGMFIALEKMVISARSQAKDMQRMNNMRQFGLAALNYESAYQKFPFLNGNQDLSWRVKVLPFIEENALYDQLDAKQGADAEVNKKFADKMPAIFGADGKNSNVVWVKSQVKGFGNITDGSSNTIMLMEYAKGTPWMENADISQEDALKMLSSLKDGEVVIVVFYDCSVTKITNKVSKETLQRMLDPQDGQIVDRDF